MAKPEPLLPRDRSLNILLLRVGIAILAIVIVVGAVYYTGYFYQLIVNGSDESIGENINPLVEHQLIIRARQEPDLLGVSDVEVLIEEFGSPVGRNLITTSVQTNSTGTALITLLNGQYTLRPSDGSTWRGLESVNLDRDREVTLLLQSQ